MTVADPARNFMKLILQNCVSCFKNHVDPLPFCWEEMGRDDIQAWNTWRMLILTKTPDNYRSLVDKCKWFPMNISISLLNKKSA